MRSIRHVVVLLSAAALIACNRGGYDDGPMLETDLSELFFDIVAGAIVEPKELVIAEAQGAEVTWYARASRPWLLVSPKSGVTPDRLVVRVQSTGLLPGDHGATLAISMDGDPTHGSPPALVAVHLTVAAPGWSSLDGPTGGYVLTVAGDGTTDGRVLAGDGHGRIWISDDGGQSFEGGAQLGESGIHDLELHAASGRAYATLWNEGVFRSDDAGETWQATAYTGGARFMAVRTDDPDELYVVNTNTTGVQRSRDGGTTWSDISPANQAFGIAAGTNPPGELLVSTLDDRGVSHSTDGGDSWQSWTMPAYSRVTAVLVSTIDPQTMVATTDGNQINLSNDGGATWTIVALGVPSGWTYDLAEGSSGILAADDSGPLVSLDRGATWSGIELPSEPFHRLTHGVAWAGSNALVTSMQLGILVGPTAAVTPSVGMFAHRIHGMAVHPTSGSVAAIGSLGGLWLRSGGSWSAIGATDLGLASNEWLTSVVRDPSDPDRLLASTCYRGVFESLDFGQTWSPSGSNAGSCVRNLSFDPGDPNVVYASAATGISRSDDRGVTFQLVRAGDAQVVIALPNGAIAFYDWCGFVRVRDNTGQETSLGMNCLAALARGADGALWIGHQDGTWVWTNASGVELVASGTGDRPTALLDDGTRVWLAHDGAGLSYSEDDGTTWHASGCPSSRITGLALDETGGSLLVGTADMGVLRYRP